MPSWSIKRPSQSIRNRSEKIKKNYKICCCVLLTSVLFKKSFFFLSGSCWQSNILDPIIMKLIPSNGTLSPLKNIFLGLMNGSVKKTQLYYNYSIIDLMIMMIIIIIILVISSGLTLTPWEKLKGLSSGRSSCSHWCAEFFQNFPWKKKKKTSSASWVGDKM